MATNQSSVAVLIDGDNVSSRYVGGLMVEVAKYGTVSVKRIYADWTTPNLKGWKACLLNHSITPIQQFAYTTGKNATDGAMIIDAMDLLYTGRFSSFCLVSSDSDFTRLASRIREQGVTVYGFGERKTNSAFINACNQFTYFDVLDVEPEESTVAEPQEQPYARLPPNRGPGPLMVRGQSFTRPLDRRALIGLARAVKGVVSDSENWVNLADVGNQLSKISPDLQPRNFGYERLKDFAEAAEIVDMKRREIPNKPPVLLVRLKENVVAIINRRSM